MSSRASEVEYRLQSDQSMLTEIIWEMSGTT
jgi:hypothetical protein